jgi:hypothetical protein
MYTFKEVFVLVHYAYFINRTDIVFLLEGEHCPFALGLSSFLFAELPVRLGLAFSVP